MFQPLIAYWHWATGLRPAWLSIGAVGGPVLVPLVVVWLLLSGGGGGGDLTALERSRCADFNSQAARDACNGLTEGDVLDCSNFISQEEATRFVLANNAVDENKLEQPDGSGAYCSTLAVAQGGAGQRPAGQANPSPGESILSGPRSLAPAAAATDGSTTTAGSTEGGTAANAASIVAGATTLTLTATPVPTLGPGTPSPTPSLTPTLGPGTPSPTPSLTPTLGPGTPSPTPSLTPTLGPGTPSPTPSLTPTLGPGTPSLTPSLTPTATSTATATATAGVTPVATATPANTAVPPTATPTNTAVPPTATPTNTAVPPTATPTLPPAQFNIIQSTISLGGTADYTGSGFTPNATTTIGLRLNGFLLGSDFGPTTDSTGSFAGSVTIPLEALTGTYRITFTDAQGRSASDTVVVQ